MNETQKKIKYLTKYNKNYFYAILCGLTGSAAALFAKEALQQDNKFYKYLATIPYGNVISIVLRILFFACMIFANAKMLEFKIRSFAAIGSSMTVVAAFIANYLFNMTYEIIQYFKFPSTNQYIGSLFCLAGVYVLKDQIAPKDTSKLDNESVEQSHCNIDESVERSEDRSETTPDRVIESNSKLFKVPGRVDTGSSEIKTQVEIQEQKPHKELSTAMSLKTDNKIQQLEITENAFDNNNV